MGVFSATLGRLMARLNSVFSKDPVLIDALQIVSSGGSMDVQLSAGTLTITRLGVTYTVTITTQTVAALVTSINALNGSIAATALNGSGTVPANYLFDDLYTGTTVTLSRPTSVLTAEMSTYAKALQEQADQITNATNELYANTADGTWLELWLKNYFGVSRISGETDAAYFQRAKNELFRIQQNNVALAQMIFNAMSWKVSIQDMAAPKLNTSLLAVAKTNSTGTKTNTALKATYTNGAQTLLHNIFGVYINALPSEIPATVKEAIKNICNKYRAAGTYPSYYTPRAMAKTNTIPFKTNDSNYVVGPVAEQWQLISL